MIPGLIFFDHHVVRPLSLVAHPLRDFIILHLLIFMSYIGLFTKTNKIRSTLTKEVTEMDE